MRHPLRFLAYLPLLLAFVSASATAQDKTQATTLTRRRVRATMLSQ